LNGGTNTYLYVDGNPIRYVDPVGLVKWSGPVTVGDAGLFGLGGARLSAQLTSECIDGEKYRVDVVGAFGGINLSIIPIGVISSSETFEDGLSQIDPYVFNGNARLSSISAALGLGYGFSYIKLGGAETPNNGQINDGPTYGFGEGALWMTGRSNVVGVPQKIECGCGQ
jgi:hypothetical protein